MLGAECAAASLWAQILPSCTSPYSSFEHYVKQVMLLVAGKIKNQTKPTLRKGEYNIIRLREILKKLPSHG